MRFMIPNEWPIPILPQWLAFAKSQARSWALVGPREMGDLTS
jgi:hypothetical protein